MLTRHRYNGKFLRRVKHYDGKNTAKVCTFSARGKRFNQVYDLLYAAKYRSHVSGLPALLVGTGFDEWRCFRNKNRILYRWNCGLSGTDLCRHLFSVQCGFSGNLCRIWCSPDSSCRKIAEDSAFLFREKRPLRFDQHHDGRLCNAGNGIVSLHSGIGRVDDFYCLDCIEPALL